MMRRTSGTPATGTAGLASVSVTGRSLVPRPAVNASACVIIGRSAGVKQHVGRFDAALLAVLHEETAVGIEDVVAGAAPEQLRRLRDAAIAAFDFNKHADRRFVDRDDAVVECELLAVLLVAEPDVEAELAENL